MTEERRKLRNEELNEFYSSPNIVRGIKSRRMRWAGHIARIRVNRTRLHGSSQQQLLATSLE